MNEYVRLEAGSMDLCRLKYILRKNEDIAGKTGLIGAILAALTNSTAVITAGLKATKRCNAPIRFTTVLDQVRLYKYNSEDLKDLLSYNNLHKS